MPAVNFAAIDAAQLHARIVDGGELALLDVREEGRFAQSHLLLARSLPLSRLELRISALVPRKSVPIVLCDDDGGLVRRAADKLAQFGYSDISLLSGGVKSWGDAGYVLFSGFNVPSKAFGEVVEHQEETPNISAAELSGLIKSGADLVVLDSRPYDEYHRMNIPTGIDTPGAELAYRVHDLAPSPETVVVVNCAGRTRSIIGAQSLINAGIPNRVVALRNGTMGWELEGFECEHGSDRRAPEPSEQGLIAANQVAQRVARRFGVKHIDMAALDEWRTDDSRSLYLLDVRSSEEFEAGHLASSVSAPGGQLVQGTDQFVGTLAARLVLIDDNGVRATMTASWLNQMGWNQVSVLDGGLQGPLETGSNQSAVPGLDTSAAETVTPQELKSLLDRGDATLVDFTDSRSYRKAHIPGAWFAVRARLETGLRNLPNTDSLVFTSEDGRLAHLAAADADRPVRVLGGGNAEWPEAGFEMAEGAENMADTPDDVWLKAYDQSAGVADAMQAYLDWEVALPAQIEADGTLAFKRFPA